MDQGDFEESLVCLQTPVLCPSSSVVLLTILSNLCDQGRENPAWDYLRHDVEEDQVERSALEHWWKDLEEVFQQMVLQTLAQCSPTNRDRKESNEDTSWTSINNIISGNVCKAGDMVVITSV